MAYTQSPGSIFSDILQTYDINRCKSSVVIDNTKELPLIIICSVLTMFGLIIAFCGYRILRMTLFVIAFSITASVPYYALRQKTNLQIYVCAIIASAIGLVFGLSSAIIYSVGLVIAGAVTGAIFGIFGLFVVSSFHEISQLWVPIVVLCGAAVICGIPALCFRRSMAIFNICNYSGFILLFAVDFFFDKKMLLIFALEKILARRTILKPCWFSWIFIAVWLFIFLTGMVVHVFFSCRGYHHDSGYQRHTNYSSGKRTRKPYSNGDVIAKPWLSHDEGKESYETTTLV